ncbi:hypothetical protein niasHS_001878 [Heterodera schachtii]|uniref:Uncharacterized protein n=1 Tax=Heterodera schachtii TaxID=97005 RepID=A0ABD2KAK0_HETSC
MDHQNSLIHNQQHYIGTCIETVIRMYSRDWDPVEEANREWFRSLQLGPPNSDRETSSLRGHERFTTQRFRSKFHHFNEAPCAAVIGRQLGDERRRTFR